MSRPIIQYVADYIKNHTLIDDDATVIIGLSGGPDSLFLLHALHILAPTHNYKLIAAHLDHEWRPSSQKDALFCKKVCDSLGVPLHTEHYSNLKFSFKYNGSQEEIGRKARRLFFTQLKNRYNANTIALGHHAQDQEETFFIRLIRGTSLSGITGIKPKDGDFIHPLLSITKQDILTYLHENSIDYCVDPTNESSPFLRSALRTKVLPALYQADHRFSTNFAKTVHRLQETEKLLQKITQHHFLQISTNTNGVLSIDRKQLLALDPVLQHRVVLYWFIVAKVPFTPSDSLLQETLRFLYNPRGGRHSLGTWSIIKHKGTIQISS